MLRREVGNEMKQKCFFEISKNGKGPRGIPQERMRSFKRRLCERVGRDRSNKEDGSCNEDKRWWPFSQALCVWITSTAPLSLLSRCFAVLYPVFFEEGTGKRTGGTTNKLNCVVLWWHADSASLLWLAQASHHCPNIYCEFQLWKEYPTWEKIQGVGRIKYPLVLSPS